MIIMKLVFLRSLEFQHPDEQLHYVLNLFILVFVCIFIDNYLIAYKNSYIHFLFLIISWARTARKMLTVRVGTSHPYLIPDFIRTASELLKHCLM